MIWIRKKKILKRLSVIIVNKQHVKKKATQEMYIAQYAIKLLKKAKQLRN